ncbi:MAG TPA: hypothetical protein VFX39_04945 [Gemmatimonadaceae bacterium]|nr:hypothetical protein [Gemmatimonadaceae bacterium]
MQPHASHNAARIRCRVALLLGAFLASGCYHYTPVAPVDVQPGRRVRAELGDQGAAELARWVGPRSVSVEGRVENVSDSALTISVTEVVRRNGVTEPWQGESVLVPRSYVASLRQRRFDRTRTLLLSAGVAAALVSVDAALGQSGFFFRGRGGAGSGGRK